MLSPLTGFVSVPVPVPVTGVGGSGRRGLVVFSGSTSPPGRAPSRANPKHSLTADELALADAGTAVALALRLAPALKGMADQLISSASSVPANLGEGAGGAGREGIHHWCIAYASALEADSHLRLLLAARVVDQAKAQTALELFGRVRAFIWRIIHPRR